MVSHPSSTRASNADQPFRFHASHKNASGSAPQVGLGLVCVLSCELEWTPSYWYQIPVAI